MKECRGLQVQGFECNFEGAAVEGSPCGEWVMSARVAAWKRPGCPAR